MRHVAALAAIIVLALPVGSPAEEIVQEFSGQGNQATRPFEVAGPWEIQWDAEGIGFAIRVMTADGNRHALAANQGEPGSGASYQPHPGQYFLDIRGGIRGGWTVRVIDLSD